MTRRITLAALVILLAAAVAAWGARGARAFDPQPDPPGFGMVGIVINFETARLNVVKLATRDATPGTCLLGLAFYDGQGALLAQSRVAIGDPNVAQALELNRDALAGRTETRLEIRPAVSFVGDPTLCVGLVATLEVVDSATGRTTLLYPTGQVGNPNIKN